MQTPRDHARWKSGNATDRLFIIAVIIKGLDGLFGLFGGIILHFVRPETLNWLLDVLTMHELSRNPQNEIAEAVHRFMESLDVSKLAFASAYLLAHGILKTFLAAMLLTGRHWAYPAGSAFLAIFVAYTGYRLYVHWSWILFCFFLIDSVTIILVAREWRAQRRLWGAEAAAAPGAVNPPA